MKAVIMAGGNGIRLRPLTCTLPKPMVKLCGRPVMEHILLLLKKHGFNSVMATLGYMPQEIENYFEGGEKLGISFDCVTEREPRGTAGSVKLCESFIGGEDFLVISGDAVCDFDLEAAAKFHRKNGADVTILTCRNTHPTRYGLVLCDKNGDVEGFLEKPSWNQVFGDQVNTGIYFIKPSVLAEIPENAAFDFAKDLFPKLLKKGSRLTVCEAKGYWCDIGDTDAYLQCVFDILNGDVNIELPAPKTGEGVYMNSVLPS
ncbi:MAG: nucleotidyltransferase family protein, partial [Bacillota bacterium]|nr:nucleotidyltransferase family protein [Bacillota bacterium]